MQSAHNATLIFLVQSELQTLILSLISHLDSTFSWEIRTRNDFLPGVIFAPDLSNHMVKRVCIKYSSCSATHRINFA